MSNLWYPRFKEKLLQGTAGTALTGDVRIVLLDSAAYSYDAGDEFLSDVPLAARVAISTPLLNKTFLNGVLDAEDMNVVAVEGPHIEAMALFVDSGDPSISPLVIFMDQVTGLPVTPDSTDISTHWNELGIAAL